MWLCASCDPQRPTPLFVIASGGQVITFAPGESRALTPLSANTGMTHTLFPRRFHPITPTHESQQTALHFAEITHSSSPPQITPSYRLTPCISNGNDVIATCKRFGFWSDADPASLCRVHFWDAGLRSFGILICDGESGRSWWSSVAHEKTP